MKKGLTEPPPPPRVLSAILPKTIFKEHSSFISINNSLDLALTPRSSEPLPLWSVLGLLLFTLALLSPCATHPSSPLSCTPDRLLSSFPSPLAQIGGWVWGGSRSRAEGGLGGGKREGQCFLPVLVGIWTRIGGQGTPTPLVLDAPLSLDCLLLPLLRLGKS